MQWTAKTMAPKTPMVQIRPELFARRASAHRPRLELPFLPSFLAPCRAKWVERAENEGTAVAAGAEFSFLWLRIRPVAGWKRPPALPWAVCIRGQHGPRGSQHLPNSGLFITLAPMADLSKRVAAYCDFLAGSSSLKATTRVSASAGVS